MPGFYDLLLFDLDGTLTDPRVGITRSVQFALSKFGIEERDRTHLESFIGPPLLDSFQDRFGFDEAQASQAVEHYREYFSEHGLYENSVYDGIPELLADLRTAGRTLAVATSKPTIYAREILRHFHLDDFFRAVHGAELDHSLRHKADIIDQALRGTLPSRSPVMIGDRKYDVEGGRRNGIDSIAVTYGYGSESELRAAAPTKIAATVDDLRALVL